MTSDSPFRDAPDLALSEALGREFEGPEPELFVTRLRQHLQVLPQRDTEWDVLAHWARPGVLVAAMAAGLLLGLTFWRSWRAPSVRSAEPVVSAALLEESRTVSPFVYTVMGER